MSAFAKQQHVDKDHTSSPPDRPGQLLRPPRNFPRASFTKKQQMKLLASSELPLIPPSHVKKKGRPNSGTKSSTTGSTKTNTKPGTTTAKKK
jgi:hypothetical protein